MMLISTKSLGEVIFKVSQEYYCILGIKYNCTFFIKAPLMETLSARCWKVQGEKKRWFGRKIFGYRRKAGSKRVTEHRNEGEIIFVVMVLIIR